MERAQVQSSSPSVIVLAAGEGTRMRSATPKVLHKLAGRSLVEHAVRTAFGLTPAHLSVVVGFAREQVSAEISTVSAAISHPINIAVQDEQRGTGHAVGCGLAAFPKDVSGTILVTYGDVPLLDTETLENLVATHEESGNSVTILTAKVANPAGYGRIVRSSSGDITGIVEHKDATAEELAITEINSGVYAFTTEILRTGLGQLSAHNSQGELYLTDLVAVAKASGLPVGAVVCPDPILVEGVNDRVQLAALAKEYNRRLTEKWMRAGVTMTDPATTWLDADVELAMDVLIEPGVQLRGTTTIGAGAVIGPDTTLTDVTVGAGASVIRTHGSSAIIGAHASVGPFAYLRPGAQLGDKGKIGTFVEVKNSTIGTGSKVPHLSYVGDATIGEHSNIGAASVFVNYDGVNKHRTTVGSHCRTGSDNMFVAPLTIGDGVYTGAGTILREDVPAGALAVSGGPQRNIENWVIKRREGTPAAQAALAEQAREDQTSAVQTNEDQKGR